MNNLEQEQKLIYLLLNYKDAVEELVSNKITDSFFSQEFRHLVKYIFQEYISSNHKRLLTRAHYLDILKQLYQADSNFDLALSLSVFDSCSLGVSAELDDLGLLKKNLVDNYVNNNSLIALEKFADIKKKHGSTYAAQVLKENLEAILTFSDSPSSKMSVLEDIKTEYLSHIDNLRKNPEETIRCFIPEIDEMINVGLKPGHLTLFAGDVGSNKSNLMLNIALNVYDGGCGGGSSKQKNSVLFVALEMSSIDLMNRIIANRADIESYKLATPKLLTDEEIESIKNCQVWTQGDVKFAILDETERTTVAKLKHIIEKHALYIKPKVVVIDYITIMGMDKELRNDLAIGEVLKDLRMLGRQYGFHVISAAQIGRSALSKIREEGFDSAKPDSTALRGSHEYSTDSDTIIAIFPLDAENKLQIYNIKSRHGKKGQLKELALDASRCRITSTAIINNLSDNINILNDEELNKPEADIEKEISEKTTKKVNWDVDLDLISDNTINNDPLSGIG